MEIQNIRKNNPKTEPSLVVSLSTAGEHGVYGNDVPSQIFP